MKLSIEKSKLEEKNKIISVLDSAFNKTKDSSFLYRYPMLFNDERILEYYVAKNEDGEIVGGAGAYKIDLVINNVKFKACGVGKVACLQEYRNQGVMQSLLTNIINDIKKEKLDISYLWGERFRYANYGWVEGGEKQVFSFWEKHLPKVDEKLNVSPVLENDIDLIYDLLKQEKTYLDLSKKDVKDMILSLRVHGYRLNNSFVFWDYDKSSIMQVLGESQDILKLISFCLFEKKKEDDKIDVVKVDSYEDSKNIKDILSKYCWVVKKKSSANFRIVSLKSFLEKFAKACEYKIPNVTEEINIGNSETKECYKIKCDNGKISILECDPSKSVMLNEKDLSEVFFGQFPITSFLKDLPSNSVFRMILPLRELIHISRLYLL